MMRIPIDSETERALAESGIRELRPPPMQAVVLIRRALGLPDSPMRDKGPGAANTGAANAPTDPQAQKENSSGAL
jgi:hypothetical protein